MGRLAALVDDLEDLEYFREEMLRTLKELQSPAAQDTATRKAILHNSLSTPITRALVADLLAYGYTGQLDSLSDCLRAITEYEGPPCCDYRGQFLADALFCARAFSDPCWPDQSEELLFRLCYRLSALFAAGRAESVRAALAAATKQARSLGGQNSGQSRRDDTAERDGKICDRGRQLLAANLAARSIASRIALEALAGGLGAKQIRTILRSGGVIDQPKEKGS